MVDAASAAQTDIGHLNKLKKAHTEGVKAVEQEAKTVADLQNPAKDTPETKAVKSRAENLYEDIVHASGPFDALMNRSRGLRAGAHGAQDALEIIEDTVLTPPPFYPGVRPHPEDSREAGSRYGQSAFRDLAVWVLE